MYFMYYVYSMSMSTSFKENLYELLQMSAFWPAQPSVAPGAKASTILTNLQVC